MGKGKGSEEDGLGRFLVGSSVSAREGLPMQVAYSDDTIPLLRDAFPLVLRLEHREQNPWMSNSETHSRFRLLTRQIETRVPRSEVVCWLMVSSLPDIYSSRRTSQVQASQSNSEMALEHLTKPLFTCNQSVSNECESTIPH